MQLDFRQYAVPLAADSNNQEGCESKFIAHINIWANILCIKPTYLDIEIYVHLYPVI